MIRGLFRVRDAWLGEGVLVDPDAGDAGPFLSREIYEYLGGEPAYPSLPARDGVGVPVQVSGRVGAIGDYLTA